MMIKRTVIYIIVVVLLLTVLFTIHIAVTYRCMANQINHEYNVLISKHYHLKSELHTLYKKRKEVKAWQTDWYKSLYESQEKSFQEEQKKRITELEAGIDLILDNYKDFRFID